jgi:hypothetical protein
MFTKIISDTGDAVNFTGDVPPLPEDMVVSTQQIVWRWPCDEGNRQRAQQALDARRPYHEIVAELTKATPPAPIAKAEQDHYSGLIDLMKDPVLKAEAYVGLQHNDRETVESLLRKDADAE